MAVAGNRIVVAGCGNNGSNFDVAVWRSNEDGTPDTGFAGTGPVLHDGGDHDFAFSVAVDSSGRILAAGNRWSGPEYDLVIWRWA